MTTVIVEHDVKNFNSWKPVYDGHQGVRDQYKLTHTRVYQAAGRPNTVCVIMEGTTKNVQAFLNDPSLREAMDKAGVVGEPTITVLENASITV